MSERIDIGHGVQVQLVAWPVEAGPDRAGKPAGFDYWHNCRMQPDVAGYVPVDGPGELWALVSLEPLTLSPSLLCRVCGHHGFIRDGKWVPA